MNDRPVSRAPQVGALLASWLVLLLLLLAAWQLSRLYTSELLRAARAEHTAEVNLQGNVLSLSLNRRMARLQGLYAFVVAQPSEEHLANEFAPFAATLLLETRVIRNLAVGPGGTFTYIYPVSGNEVVLGYQPLNDARPEVRDDVLRAIATGQTIISGPLDLLQGGQGLILRQAVFKDGEYWGLLSMVLDLPAMLEEAGLAAPHDVLRFALRDETGRILYGSPAVFDEDPVLNTIELPDGVWELAAVPRGGWPAAITQPLRVFQIASILIAFLLSVLTYLSVNNQVRLRLAVQQRTQQISSINEQLERDIARRKIVESALRQRDQLLERRVKERTQQLSALLQVSAHVASTLELEPLLKIILQELHSVVNYSGGMILLWQGEGLAGAARQGAVSAELEPWLRRPLQDIERELGWANWRETTVVADVRPILRRSGAAAPLAREVRAWMAVPLMGRKALIGVVIVYHREPGYYTPRHNDLATAIARQAAVAIENAQLYEQGQHLAVLQERQRLARELHDSVSQALYGIALGARTASTLLAKDPQRAGEPLNYVLSLAEAGLAEMRALIFELRPETLENEGLVAALERQIAALRARHELEVMTEFASEPQIALPAKEALYRVAQEATNNIVKHARATQVHIALHQEDGLLTLTVADDGRGFDPDRDFPGHLGLKTMRERMERLGGSLHIESRPGSGTRVQAEVPLSVQW